MSLRQCNKGIYRLAIKQFEIRGSGHINSCGLTHHAIKHFNKYFNKNLEVCDDDSIDIYKAKNKEEIFDFLAHPVPFCRYCNPDIKDYSLNWEPTTKKIDEWT